MALVIKTTGLEDYLEGGQAFVKALILGPPSAGKTRSASFWPKPIFADCEKGRMSIADRNVPYGEITSSDDMKTLIRALRVECAKPVDQRRYQTLVIDTLDAYQRIVIQERLTAEKKEALSGFGDWGYLDAKMTQLVHSLLSLPMNIVVNVHTKDTGGGDDPVVTGVKLKGDIKDQIAAEFDLVGLMGMHWEAVNGERVLTRSVKWWPEPNVPILKDRSGRLPRFTPVSFTEDDYLQLFRPLHEAVSAMEASADVEVMQGEEPTAEPAAPEPGGAVAQPVTPAKKAAAKKAPAKAVPPAVPAKATATKAAPKMEVVEGTGASPAPTAVATNVPPAAPAPVPSREERDEAAAAAIDAWPGSVSTEAGPVDPATGEVQQTWAAPPGAPTEEEAVANAVEGLGGTVLEEPQAPEEAPQPAAEAPPAAPAPEQAATPVCGTPGRSRDGSSFEAVPGCGKSLADENEDVVNIGLVRTGRQGRPTYLCAACMAAHKAAS